MISISNLNKTFYSGSTAVVALSDLTLEIGDQEFCTLIGANGSGKSTFMECLSGEAKADTGRIVVDGLELSAWPVHRRASLISRMFQDPRQGTAGELTILENLRLASLRTGIRTLRNSGTAAFKARARAELAQLGMGLENRLDDQVSTLSGGQRQALSLIMAVQHSTRLLLLDEPGSALDPASAARINTLIERLQRERKFAVLFVTHNMQDAIDMGSRLLVLRQGKIDQDVVKTRHASLNLQQLYGWISGQVTKA